jgi:hypothetical protein
MVVGSKTERHEGEERLKGRGGSKTKRQEGGSKTERHRGEQDQKARGGSKTKRHEGGGQEEAKAKWQQHVEKGEEFCLQVHSKNSGTYGEPFILNMRSVICHHLSKAPASLATWPCIFPHLPASSPIFLRLLASSCDFPHLPAPSCIFLHLPASSCIFPHLTCIFPHPPASSSSPP